MTTMRIAAAAALAAAALAALWLAPAGAYDTYHPATANDGCFQCHTGFFDRGPLHDLHVGNSQMTSTCTLCHTSVGDNPHTGTSGTDASHGCNGCHAGAGLRLHHANAGAPADGAGRVCSACHINDPTPPAESVKPPYYGRADVRIAESCRRGRAILGEDFDGDGRGLDNDGDLSYDGDDPDCAPIAGVESSWSVLKGHYRR